MKKECFYKEISSSQCVSIGLLALRVVCGLAFIHHGSMKIQNPFHWMGPDATTPAVLQALAAISEFGGGIAWVMGLLTPLACLGIFCTMSVAVWTLVSQGDPFIGMSGPSYELALVYWSVALALFMAGPGRYSVDHILFNGRGSKKLD